MHRNVEPSDLARRLCYALSIAQQSLELLGAEGYTNPELPDNTIRPEKIVAETGLLLYVASLADTGQGVKQRIERVARLLIPLVRTQKILLEVCLQPALAFDYAQAHIFLTRAGFPDPGFDALLTSITNVQTSPLRERFPHRMLEQEWVGRLWKNEPPDNNPIRSISLGRSLDLLHGTRDDLYAFTHAMMYVCGFEGHSNPLPRQTTELLKEAESMLARCLDDQDYDLAAEILLAWPLTKSPWSSTASFAFHVLRQIEDQVGFLPSGSTRVQQLKNLEGIERKKYFLATSYHTIYVMGLLCAVSLHTTAAPAEIDPDPVNLLSYLKDDKPPHWLAEFEALNQPDQSPLTKFIFDVALSRNVREKNYSAVYELLNIAMEQNIADTPMAAQAAGLLDRLALFASFVPAQ